MTTRRLLLLAVAAAVVLGAPATAAAKGATKATVTGPGVDSAITIGGNGEPGSGSTLGTLAESAGFFPAVFRQSPDPMLPAGPKGSLGPKYVISYVMPGPNGSSSTIRQHVYPYAQPTPVTYTPSGQRIWNHQTTRGGWYAASPALKTVLVAAGLPKAAPTSESTEGFALSTPLVATLAVAATLALLAAGTMLALRRRPGPAV